MVLHPKASFGIKRDSTIVGLFILFHVGSRYLGSTSPMALAGGDPWQPFATLGSNLWASLPIETLEVLEHVFFWGAIGSIMLFIPYFLISKHIHLLMGPVNFALKPVRRSMGELDKINFEDESITQFGVSKLEHLSQAAIAGCLCLHHVQSLPGCVPGQSHRQGAVAVGVGDQQALSDQSRGQGAGGGRRNRPRR